MDIKKVSIYHVDLKKLMDRKGFNLKSLAVKADVNYEYLLRCQNGHFKMSEEHWEKIKKVL